MTATIPSPRAYPIIGNLLDLQDEVPIHALERLVDIYGPIFKFRIGAREQIVVGDYELFNELCDETRFWKVPQPQLAGKGAGEAKGLFGSPSEKSEDWGQAHRILMPAFGPLAVEGMFDEMNDIASQCMLKWARQGPDKKILSSEDFSRLTLDTIALCAMDYRFNSFYQEEPNPFVQAMTNDLLAKSRGMQLSGMLYKFLPGRAEALQKDHDYMTKTGESIVQHRRENPTEKKDLLNSLLYGKDPKTGYTMRDELIVANMRTFLVAGHETTSGLLTFVFANLLKNPSTYFAAQQEVDRVVGRDKIGVKHLSELKYINAVLRETLRLTPTAPAFLRGTRPESKELHPSIGGGKFAMPEKGGMVCLLTKIQKDPKVWGDDAEEFKPERMLGDKFDALPANAWKPFGTGMRACIGRAFAWQEALLVVALILQNFDMRMDDPNYELRIVQTLTIKPKDFFMRATLRPGLTATGLQERLLGSVGTAEVGGGLRDTDKEQDTKSKVDLQILYGSNTGTCEALARKLASQAGQHGFSASVQELDAVIEQVSTTMPTAIITASYEGQPCDNAARFVAWMQSLQDPTAMKGVKYAVFGVGHSDWHSTYQHIPGLIDQKLSELGATRTAARGQTDVSKNNLFADFEDWAENVFWPSLPKPEGLPEFAPSLLVKGTIKTDVKHENRAAALQQHLQWAKVLDVKQLTAPGLPQKRHIEIELPEGMSYQVGDYLAVLPLNPKETVKRVMKRFWLGTDSMITIEDAGPTTLPVGLPLHVDDLLKGYVELSQPATLRDIRKLEEHAAEASDKQKLADIENATIYEATILQHRISILDLLQEYPSIDISFDQFLTMLPPLQPRHYSISSSSLAQPKSCSLTYSVINAPTLSGLGDRFHGVTGTYLQGIKKDDEILVSVRATNKQFRLPADPEKTPIVMFCAGSGIAPFRGFVQERAFLIREGQRSLAKALLFIGCRSKAEDALYYDELAEWASIGAVDVRYAFSHEPEKSEGCKHVQDRLMLDRKEVVGLFKSGAVVYTCGSREVAKELGFVAREMVKELMEERGTSLGEGDVEGWMKGMRNERFVSDVFT